MLGGRAKSIQNQNSGKKTKASETIETGKVFQAPILFTNMAELWSLTAYTIPKLSNAVSTKN